jgi:hypothetical protein
MTARTYGIALSFILCVAAAAAARSAGLDSSAAQGREPLCRRAPALLPPPREARERRFDGALTVGGGEVDSMAGTGTRVRGSSDAAAPPADAPAPLIDLVRDRTTVIVSNRRSSPAPETSYGYGPSAVAGVVNAMPSAPARPGERRGPPPQSGQLTAGDHDDLLNPDLYADYVGTFLQDKQVEGVPFVDTRRVLTVEVRDRSGRPIPFATVRLTCADGNSLAFDTLADGSAVFFPSLDRLGGEVRLTVLRGGRAEGGARTIAIADGAGTQRHEVTLAGEAAPVRRFDLAIVIDTTGSMSDEIDFLKAELRAILADLRRGHPGLDVRLALVAYRDLGDEYVVRTYDFTGEEERMQAGLAAQIASGGGDYPEAMDQAMASALALGWRPEAVHSLLLVADAPPHDENIARTWAAAEAARAARIQIVPVAASGVGDTAEYVMRAMAAATQSRYLFLTDDSGIGNAHAEPAIDCYLVTRLDGLVRRVLDGQISGRRIEPRESEVIRAVGDYDHGRCALPRDFRPKEPGPRQ